MIPIVIICYNNHEYVQNMLQTLNQEYLKNVIILDNHSDRRETIAFLNKVPVRVHFNETNQGPWVSPQNNTQLYNSLPQRFILTDPDLQLNPKMPSDCIEQMVRLSERYPSASKIGLALDISDHELFFQENYTNDMSIHDHESQFWKERIVDPDYELYHSPLDTTFCLVNKALVDQSHTHIRIGGVFTCKHLPWYKSNPILSLYENYIRAKSNTTISTTSKLIVSSIEKEYLSVKKHDQTLLIQNDPLDKNLQFWRDTFSNWEPTTFRIFDRFLDPTKTCIDLGGWIGTTCIYASRKSKNVLVVEADPLSYKDLQRNCKLNDCKNVTAVHKAIFNETGRTISIVGNNESVSQIAFDDSGHSVNTISIHALLLDAKIDPSTISIIKVDIEGAEEFILKDLYSLHTTYDIPLYVSFHYPFFKDKNLDRFDFLTEEQKGIIRDHPFPSLLFRSSSQVEYFI